MFAFTLRQIEVFLAVCEAGSFRRAADRLGISEASVSNHMRSLEDQLGCRLFDRRRGTTSSLSDKGLLLLEGAKRLVALGNELGRSLRSGAEKGVNLRLFVGPHILEDYVRPALPEFVRSHPHVELTFVTMASRAEARKAALAGRLDGILMTFADDDAPPGSVPLAPVELGVYGRAELIGQIGEGGIGSIPFLLGARGSEDEDAALHNLRAAGIPSPIVGGRYPYHDVGVGMALKGLGGLATFRSIIDIFDPEGELCVLHRIADWQRRLYLRPGLDPAVVAIVTDFFRSAAGPRPYMPRRSAGDAGKGAPLPA